MISYQLPLSHNTMKQKEYQSVTLVPNNVTVHTDNTFLVF